MVVIRVGREQAERFFVADILAPVFAVDIDRHAAQGHHHLHAAIAFQAGVHRAQGSHEIGHDQFSDRHAHCVGDRVHAVNDGGVAQCLADRANSIAIEAPDIVVAQRGFKLVMQGADRQLLVGRGPDHQALAVFFRANPPRGRIRPGRHEMHALADQPTVIALEAGDMQIWVGAPCLKVVATRLDPNEVVRPGINDVGNKMRLRADHFPDRLVVDRDAQRQRAGGHDQPEVRILQTARQRLQAGIVDVDDLHIVAVGIERIAQALRHHLGAAKGMVGGQYRGLRIHADHVSSLRRCRGRCCGSW